MNRILSVFAITVWVAMTSSAQTPQRQLRPSTVLGSRGALINDVQESKVATHPATPFTEASTLGVLDIDLKGIDVRQTADWLVTIGVITAEKEMDDQVDMASGFIDSLQAAGVEHIYVTASTRSFLDGGPLVIVPCKNPTVVNGLATVILQAASEDPSQSVHVGEQWVLAGAKAVVERVHSRDGIARADLILPLKEDGRLDHVLVLSLPEESRNELIAFWPDRLPERSPIQFSPRGMIQDIDQVVVSFRLPPDPQVRARIKTIDAAAATRVIKVVRQIVGLAPQARDAVDVKVESADVLLEAAPEVLAEIAKTLILPARRTAQDASTMNVLKQFGLAIHNYYDAEKHLPPRCLTDRAGKPLLSWRVVLLPYLGQQDLYNQFELDQSWDSDQNRPFAETVIPVFETVEPSGETRFRVPAYPGSLWQGAGPPKRFKDVSDGTSNTIAIIHAPASAAIEWSNPEPWVLSEDDPMSDVFGDRDRAAVVFLDGAARVFTRDELDNPKLKAMLTYAGGEDIQW